MASSPSAHPLVGYEHDEFFQRLGVEGNPFCREVLPDLHVRMHPAERFRVIPASHHQFQPAQKLKAGECHRDRAFETTMPSIRLDVPVHASAKRLLHHEVRAGVDEAGNKGFQSFGWELGEPCVCIRVACDPRQSPLLPRKPSVNPAPAFGRHWGLQPT